MSEDVKSAEDAEIGLREFYDSLGAHQSRLFSSSAAYNQVIVLAGYAAFFAIWSTMADDLPRWLIKLSGGLILMSVIIYVGWTVIGMFVMHKNILRVNEEFSKGFVDFYARVAAAETAGLLSLNRIMRFWKPVVYSAGGAAFIAATLLAGGAFLSVFTGDRPIALPM